MSTVDMGPVISAAQAYGDARAAEAEQAAHDEDAAQITDLEGQVNTLEAQASQDAATIADLRQQLADCQGGSDPEPPPPPVDPPKTATLVVGARAKDTDFATMDKAIGPVKASRWFSPGSGGLPATFTRKYAGTEIPAGADVWASFNSASDATLTSYVKSADPGTKMVLHHEPEGDFPNGKAYVDWFTHAASVIHAANPDMPTVHAAAAYGYRKGGEGADGSYIPPASACDIYTIDTYRRTLADMVPLEQDDRFQLWLSLVPKDAPIGLTEYGRGLVTEGAATDKKRAELIAADDTYLRSLGRVVVWMYWWTSGSAGDWRFTDAASTAAWRNVAAGN